MKTQSLAIRKKLMAAVSMLMVSVIMLVSSTYAWFTLSTAPEITGISTTVGANGNLEMALVPTDGDTSNISTSVGDSTLVTTASNITWGNMIDLSDASYGLDVITLLPAALNTLADGTIDTDAILSTPSYGADGRISELVENTTTASYDTLTSMFSGTDAGVNAIGVIGGISDRQYDFRNYKSGVNSDIASATAAATTSLSENGDALASLVLAMEDDDNSEGNYVSYVDDIKAMIAGLESSVDYMNEVVINTLLVYAANTSTLSDEDYATVETFLTAKTVDLSDSSIASVITVAGLTDTIAAIEAISTQLTVATTAISVLDTTTVSKDDITTVLTYLVDPDKVTLNGSLTKDLGDDALNSVLSDGFNIALPTGSGVYSDIAELVGDYQADVTVASITYGGYTLTNVAVVVAATGVDSTGNLEELATTMNSLTYAITDEAVGESLTDTYGYAIDLAFKTNAAGSNLLLQTEATQRVYTDSENTETLGGGSTMTFESTDASFSAASVLSLMNSICVVFTDDSGNILLEAELDTANAILTESGAGYTADLVSTTESDVITALTQNVATSVTAIVYLNGETVTNADVAAEAETSMTGTMNLQFASDASLVPMDNADLYATQEIE